MRWTVVALVLVLGGCSLPTWLTTERAEVFGAKQIAPPPEYAEWYAEVEGCFRTQGSFESLRWFVADSIVTPDGRRARGLWRMRALQRVVYIDREFLDDRRTVRHEIGHDLLLGDPGHKEPVWPRCNLYYPH